MISRRLSKVRELGRKSLRNHGEQPLIDLDELAYSEDLVLGDWLPPPTLSACLGGPPEPGLNLHTSRRRERAA